MTPFAVFPNRQIHLDFHTSPYIPEVARDFDADIFADTIKKSHVNSVTIFAKCHHGQCYYPTQSGVSHPAMGERDLLGEQIEALHQRGIRAPIYTTVVWEEDVAQKHPEWRQVAANGSFAEDGVGPDGLPGHLGMWKFNNFLNPDYQDYFEAHLLEILERYGKEVDGFFIDILFFHPKAGFSEASLAFKEKHGLKGNDPATFARFQGLAQAAFAKRFTSLIQGHQPGATIFYNAQNDGNMDPHVGPRTRAEWQTHCEIESLPSGFWGYQHFPRMARAQARWGKPWLGMTGRFQKMWGDFGGIKPQAALEFECFRAQALGGANSVGDQLPPRGVLDPAAYELIGSVYKQVKEAEPFYEGAQLMQPKIGIFSASYAGHDGGKSEEGVVQLCEDFHYDCAMLDSFDCLKGFDLLILPDSTTINEKLAAKLHAYHQDGGKLLISHRGGFNEAGEWALGFLPLRFNGEVEKYPTFWRAREAFMPEMAASDRVLYAQGKKVIPGQDFEVLVDRVLPYFKRSDLRFSSHFQTPPVEEVDPHPAVVCGNGVVYFADPIFREYRQTGNFAVKQVWQSVMNQLIGPPAFGHGLPTTVLIFPMQKENKLLLTLLHYIPIRKAMDIDVIEEPHSFAGLTMRLEEPTKSLKDWQSGETLEQVSPSEWRLPAKSGRLLLEIEFA